MSYFILKKHWIPLLISTQHIGYLWNCCPIMRGRLELSSGKEGEMSLVGKLSGGCAGKIKQLFEF
jgi:hypothetical protein